MKKQDILLFIFIKLVSMNIYLMNWLIFLNITLNLEKWDWNEVISKEITNN